MWPPCAVGSSVEKSTWESDNVIIRSGHQVKETLGAIRIHLDTPERRKDLWRKCP